MRGGFSYELYFCYSRVRTLEAGLAVFTVVSLKTGSAWTSLESKFLSKIHSDGWKGQSGDIKNLVPLSKELSKTAFADKLRIPASAVLSPVGTWFHSSTVVNSKKLATLIATNTGFFPIEWNHWRTSLLSIHLKLRSKGTVSACWILSFSRVAMSAACSSKDCECFHRDNTSHPRCKN